MQRHALLQQRIFEAEQAAAEVGGAGVGKGVGQECSRGWGRSGQGVGQEWAMRLVHFDMYLGLQAKQKRRLQRVSPRKSDGVQLTVHGLVSGLEGSVVDIVVDKEQTPPTTETRVSPNPASMDCTGD